MDKHKQVQEHSGNKYLRKVMPACAINAVPHIDVYCVLEAFGVTCPARQHAIKKLLCAGLRGKGSQIDDLQGAIDALYRAVELRKERERVTVKEDGNLATLAGPGRSKVTEKGE